MKRLLIILFLAAGTAYGQIDNPPSSVDIVDATAIGRAVLTAPNAAAGRGALGGSSFGGSIFTGSSASARPTLIASILGFSATNNLGFDSSLTNLWVATNPAAAVTALGATTVGNSVFTATNPAAAQSALFGTNPITFTNPVNFGFPNESSPAFGVPVEIYGTLNINAADDGSGGEAMPSLTVGAFTANGFTGTNTVTINTQDGIIFGGDAAGLTRTNLGLGGTNTATFGNVVLNNDGNLAPAQTADSGDSLMTRGLSDVRYPTSVFITQFSDNATVTNGGFKFVAPSRINAFSLGYGASVPSGFTQFRVILSFGLKSDPATNSTNFPVFVRFNNMNAVNNNPTEAEHATLAGVPLYPTNDTGLTGTMTRLGAFVAGGTTNAVYSYISDFETIPSAWQSNAASNGMYHFIGVAVRNNTGDSITDGFTFSHAFVGLIEFRK